MTVDARRQRQRDSIVAAAAAGDVARATALLAEHLMEFPEDHDLLASAADSARIIAKGR
jgi:DNA-binding GntR family transcriptional regulator